MKKYFIFQNVARFRINWDNLTEDCKGNCYLIRSKQHSEGDNKPSLFKKMVMVNHFTFEELREVIKTLMISENISTDDLIFATHDEYSVAVVSELRSEFGVDGDFPEITLPFVHKVKSKEILGAHRVPMPKFKAIEPELVKNNVDSYVQQITGNMSFPLFAKPTQESGSVDTKKIKNKNELKAWLQSISNHAAGSYEIDEFIDGILFHCDIVIDNRKVLNYFVGQYAFPCHEAFAGKVLGSLLLKTESKSFEAIKSLAQKALSTIVLPESAVLHLEAFQRPNGEAVFLEMAMRPPGTVVPYIYEDTIGMNIEELHYRIQMKLPYKYKTDQSMFAAWISYHSQPGTLREKKPIHVKSVHKVMWKVAEGDQLESPDSRFPICHLLLRNTNFKQLQEDFVYLSNDFFPALIDN